MKKRYIVLICLGFFTTILIILNNLNAEPKLGVVICKGPNSTAYHSSFYCEGLGVCKKYADVVSEKEAIQTYGRNPCNYCYPNADQLEDNFENSNKLPANIDDIPFYGTDN